MAYAGPESTDPIVFGQQDWTGSTVTSNIAKKLLEKMGYNVKVVPVDATAVFTGLQTGDVTFVTEIWMSSEADMAAASLKTGKTVEIGPTGLIGWDRYWYPEYVKEKCPACRTGKRSTLAPSSSQRRRRATKVACFSILKIGVVMTIPASRRSA